MSEFHPETYKLDEKSDRDLFLEVYKGIIITLFFVCLKSCPFVVRYMYRYSLALCFKEIKDSAN